MVLVGFSLVAEEPFIQSTTVAEKGCPFRRTASRTTRPVGWGQACPALRPRPTQARPRPYWTPRRRPGRRRPGVRAGRRLLANMVAPGFVLGLLLPLILRARTRAGEAAWLDPIPRRPAQGPTPVVLGSAPPPAPHSLSQGRGRGLQPRPALRVLLGWSSRPFASSLQSAVRMRCFRLMQSWVYLSGEARGVFELLLWSWKRRVRST